LRISLLSISAGISNIGFSFEFIKTIITQNLVWRSLLSLIRLQQELGTVGTKFFVTAAITEPDMIITGILFAVRAGSHDCFIASVISMTRAAKPATHD
jgi:hypothetical protein